MSPDVTATANAEVLKCSVEPSQLRACFALIVLTAWLSLGFMVASVEFLSMSHACDFSTGAVHASSTPNMTL